MKVVIDSYGPLHEQAQIAAEIIAKGQMQPGQRWGVRHNGLFYGVTMTKTQIRVWPNTPIRDGTVFCVGGVPE